jgi:cysteine-rich repeat protein
MMRLRAVVLAVLLVACGDKSPAGSGECGDGVVDTGEACDDGAQNGSTGCTSSCTFVCVEPLADCGAPPACQVALCTTDHACIFIADTTQDDTSCGTGQHCSGGSCVSNGQCGNAIIEGTEACDFGSANGPGTGCEDDCKLSCADQAACDDNDLCNGAETCVSVTDTASGNTGKKCTAGTPANPGTSCGTDKVCVNAACVAATCGDSFTTSPEECDDANPTAGDGCENNCSYSCVSTDTARNCTPADACKGQGTCNDTNHTCTPGTPLGNNTPCGTGGYCQNTVCTQPVCPDGNKTPNETCDDGNQNNGDGCDTDCTYSCVTPATDCGTPPACQKFQCSGTHTCQAVADTAKNGMSCGSNGETCTNGACTGGVCGNAVTEAGEQCDFGTGVNGAGTGCETSCAYSCTSSSTCLDANPCNGAETCASVTVSGHMGQKCAAGTPLADNTSCGTGKICKAQACVASTCGDGYVDASAGEYCEPPNSGTCDSKCRPKVCGDGIRADGEQCDDGNTNNLDGCSKTCKFEQCQRLNDLRFVYSSTSNSCACDMSVDAESGQPWCPANALGKAVGGVAQTQMNDALNTGISDGSITVFMQFMGLDDLSGTADPALTIGLTGGAPVVPGGTVFDKGRWTSTGGNADLDWWYTVSAADLDANRVPIATVPGHITAKTLRTDPSNMKFTVNFVGVDVTMNMFNAKIRAQTGSATTPLTSSGTTPGHLAAEHLDPALTSFDSMGTHDSNGVPSAELCGATTAGSLYNTFVPAAVTQNCPSYDISHTLLDLYIGGCKVFFITVIAATQPDTSRNNNGNDDYVFTFNTTTHRVTGCTKNGGAMQAVGSAGFTDCLNNAGYSTLYRISADRVIGK